MSVPGAMLIWLLAVPQAGTTTNHRAGATGRQACVFVYWLHRVQSGKADAAFASRDMFVGQFNQVRSLRQDSQSRLATIAP
ncbi:hypothetical protein HaLaN_23890 [Haematococcus lacustris]|uniref:Secreted protein n=1 Tax=Haematococcus lacustris TaxID=44745 RepID=A0A6A0A4L5_HAELA|nr:hypothetical protein HaLaN_23890 [Haematococcus lacustris]